jgi:hypothetical protein
VSRPPTGGPPAGEGTNIIHLYHTRANSFQIDGGAGNDRVAVTTTTGRDYPAADSVNVLGGTGNDRIDVANARANFPAVSGGVGDDVVPVTGVAADYLPLGPVTWNTEAITGFRNVP